MKILLTVSVLLLLFTGCELAPSYGSMDLESASAFTLTGNVDGTQINKDTDNFNCLVYKDVYMMISSAEPVKGVVMGTPIDKAGTFIIIYSDNFCTVLE